MGGKNMLKRKPEIRMYAGPNGSGKSTITHEADILPPYINADVIQKDQGLTNIDAAKAATAMRELAISQKLSFTFETVLSTDRNILLLEKAKAEGYFVRCAFVLTVDPSINVLRVQSRVADGGHDVPVDKIISRYHKALTMIPKLLSVCDRLNIYDNTMDGPVRIFKKRNDVLELFPNDVWSEDEILNLVKLGHK